MSFKTKPKSTKTAKVEVVKETPDLSIVPRVDGPDILAIYENKVAAFKKRAVTLTVTNENQTEEMQEARTMRLQFRDARIAAEKKRVELVGEAKKKLSKIDADFKAFKDNCLEIEDRLEKQEKFLEIRDAARREEVKAEREKAVLFFGDLNPSIDLGGMTDEGFDKYLADCEAARDFRIAEEKRKQEEIIANDKERERLRIENAKLQAEQEEKDARIWQMEQDRKTREAQEAQEEYERQQAIEKEKREAKKAASAPDKEKLTQFAASVRNFLVPTCKTEDGKRIAAEVQAKVTSFSNWILTQISEL